MKCLLIVGAALMLAGCSHNVGTAFSGTLVNVGYDPEINKVGIQYYDGLLVTGVSRENSEMTLEYADKASGAAGTEASASGELTGNFKYSHKVGRQVTGYYVEAIEAGATPEQIAAYVNGGEVATEEAADAVKEGSAESAHTTPEAAATEATEGTSATP